jgi:hypothetical protein
MSFKQPIGTFDARSPGGSVRRINTVAELRGGEVAYLNKRTGERWAGRPGTTALANLLAQAHPYDWTQLHRHRR